MNQSVKLFGAGILGLVCLLIFSASAAAVTVSVNASNGVISTNTISLIDTATVTWNCDFSSWLPYNSTLPYFTICDSQGNALVTQTATGSGSFTGETGTYTITAFGGIYYTPGGRIYGAVTGSVSATVNETTSPVVQITSPQANAEVGGTVVFQANASDNAFVTKVEFYLDGNLFQTVTAPPYQCSWDSTWSSGSHTIKAIAYNPAENTATDSITISLDHEAYSVSSNNGVTQSVSFCPTEMTLVNYQYDMSAAINGSFSITASSGTVDLSGGSSGSFIAQAGVTYTMSVNGGWGGNEGSCVYGSGWGAVSYPIPGATEPGPPKIEYTLLFNGGISDIYTISLPNILGSEINIYNGTQTIGSVASVRNYPIHGHYKVAFSDTGAYDGCWDTPNFQIQGIESPVNIPVNSFTNSYLEGDFIIPAGKNALFTFDSGSYYSRFLGFLWITNQWGLIGQATITYYFDSAAPDPPGNFHFTGTLANPEGEFTQGTVTLAWDPAIDNPPTYNGYFEQSGIQGYKITDIDPNGNSTDLTPGGGYFNGNTLAVTLSGSGKHTLQLVAYDNEGNASTATERIIFVDQAPPTAGVSIISDTGNSQYTKDSNVNISLSNITSYGPGGSGSVQVCVSNDNITYSPWQPCTSRTMLLNNWPLATVSGDGPKTVYFKFKDVLGEETPDANPLQATITLYTQPPTGDFAINNGAITTTSQTVTVSFLSLSHDIATMQFSNDGVNFTQPTAYAATVSWTLTNGVGNKTVSVILTDQAGNSMAQPISHNINYTGNNAATGNLPGSNILTLKADATWTSNCIIYGEVIVPAGIKLTISPGVTVTIDGPAGADPCQDGLIVYGTLVVGTGAAFTPNTSDLSEWMGILVYGSADVEGAQINSAQRGLAFINNAAGATETVNGCIFSQNVVGIHVFASQPAITNCTFQGNTFGIKEDANAAPTVNSCDFTQNSIDYYHEPLTNLTMDQLNQLPGNSGNHDH